MRIQRSGTFSLQTEDTDRQTHSHDAQTAQLVSMHVCKFGKISPDAKTEPGLLTSSSSFTYLKVNGKSERGGRKVFFFCKRSQGTKDLL